MSEKIKEVYELEVIDVIETAHNDVEKGTNWKIISMNDSTGERITHKVEKNPIVQIGHKVKITYSSDQTTMQK